MGSAARATAEGTTNNDRSYWSATVIYIQQKQKEFHRELARGVRAIRTNQSVGTVWSLIVASFLYGIFHAAGPGHGKAVISTYLLTHKNRVKQGLGLSVAAAFVQGLVAILLVEGMVGLFNLANKKAQLAVGYLETASFALITMVGLLLCFRGMKSLIADVRRKDHHHDHCPSCGHGHHHLGPDQLEEKTGLKERAGLVLSIGIRPCSGAVLILLLTHLLNMPLVGIAAVLAMSAGTAITVSLLALMALYAKKAAQSFIDRESKAVAMLGHGTAVAGGLIVTFLGAVLLQGSIGGNHPIL